MCSLYLTCDFAWQENEGEGTIEEFEIEYDAADVEGVEDGQEGTDVETGEGSGAPVKVCKIVTCTIYVIYFFLQDL